MRRLLLSLTVLVVAGVLSFGQGNGQKWTAPARAAAKKNPVAVNETSIALGKKIYERQCLVCHGATGDGKGAFGQTNYSAAKAGIRQGSYTVLGREVNLASRLENASGRGRIFISQTTFEHLRRDDPALAEWVRARNTLQPVGTYSEPVPAGNAESAAIPRVFIHCTRNPVTTPRLFDAFAEKARAAGWKVYEVASGHLAMLTAPNEVAEVLLRVSED